MPQPAIRSLICDGWTRSSDRIERRVHGVGTRLDQIADELLVLNGIVFRLESREVETTGLKAMLDRCERWLGDLGRRIAELEGAPKE
jgi:hypothetical protein